ncbi:MAG TPA: hypothetical protein VFS24_17090 [Steroidobacteraceae bacterium]|nr:hypothetical protein [Steroidobacteraceae bacterium]
MKYRYMGEINARQRGAALIVAVFMLVVVAVLGAFAINIGSNQQQSGTLALTQARAYSAAYSAVEYGSYLVRTGGSPSCPNALMPVPIPGAATAMNNYVVRWRCTFVTTIGVGTVFTVTGIATYGAYGSPDYVQRAVMRRVSDIPPTGSW